MTNQEFSDTFDTLLNSYASQVQFGDEASKQEIVLDEYEKSVLLTQAQDIILKSFFDSKQNSTGEGFDDSTRRQVDFSSLITAKTLLPKTKMIPAESVEYNGKTFPITDKGVAMGWVGDSNWTAVSPFMNQGSVFLYPDLTTSFDEHGDSNTDAIELCEQSYDSSDPESTAVWGGYSAILGDSYTFNNNQFVLTTGGWVNINTLPQQEVLDTDNVFDDRGIIYNMPLRKYPKNGQWIEKPGTTDVLFILNEQLKTTIGENGASITKNYVIVPINYREYDREMTKAYAQPLKKQVWRLFQNSTQGFDIQSELIPRWNLADNETIVGYKIRYIRRPCPIVLVDLPNELEIDGFTKAQECELNPILHPEILQKALELAINTRGRVAAPSRNQEQ